MIYRLLSALLAFAASTLPANAEPNTAENSASTPAGGGATKAEQKLASASEACAASRRYTFSWSLEDACQLQPRGGTSTGAAVTHAPSPSPQWQALLEPEISSFERDRRAILAMAGAYQTRFEFIETVGFTPDYERSAPYQSWGTEYVYVVEDRKDFISLQHIMVMFFVDDGKVTGPMVMKHWRQDWQFQKPHILSYVGANTWQKHELDRPAVAGTWAQAVYQVDDSPRYESYGRWQHFPNFSTWQSERTWRPLPRREHSVRSDYQVLEGINRHTIVPDGWVHEQENHKVRLAANGQLAPAMPYLAKELGVNRYTRIADFDFSAGEEYWRTTGPFWREVRKQWRTLIEDHAGFTLLKTVDDKPLHIPLFERAQALMSDPQLNKQSAAFIANVLASYVVVQPEAAD